MNAIGCPFMDGVHVVDQEVTVVYRYDTVGSPYDHTLSLTVRISGQPLTALNDELSYFTNKAALRTLRSRRDPTSDP